MVDSMMLICMSPLFPVFDIADDRRAYAEQLPNLFIGKRSNLKQLFNPVDIILREFSLWFFTTMRDLSGQMAVGVQVVISLRKIFQIAQLVIRLDTVNVIDSLLFGTNTSECQHDKSMYSFIDDSSVFGKNNIGIAITGYSDYKYMWFLSMSAYNATLITHGVQSLVSGDFFPVFGVIKRKLNKRGIGSMIRHSDLLYRSLNPRLLQAVRGLFVPFIIPQKGGNAT